MPDISDTIEQTAIDGVQSATADGQTVVAVPLPDQIAADKYLAAKAALAGANPRGGPKSAWNATRVAVFVPPGAA